MNYEDFVWFMLSEEDKTTLRSVNYWFKVIDLDDNLIITPHEMEYFYEEQVHRLEYLNHEPILFVDLLCQMNDLVKPSYEGHFKLSELKQVKTQMAFICFFSFCYVFLYFLTVFRHYRKCPRNPAGHFPDMSRTYAEHITDM